MATSLIPARPTLLDEASALWSDALHLPVMFVRFVGGLARWVVDGVVALLTHPAQGRHAGQHIAGHTGADDESVEELAGMREEGVDTEALPVFEDVTATGFEPSTGVLPVPLDLEDAALWDIPRGSFVLVDPTEIAFTAGAHLLDGA